jgi:hypothetical protein
MNWQLLTLKQNESVQELKSEVECHRNGDFSQSDNGVAGREAGQSNAV